MKKGKRGRKTQPLDYIPPVQIVDLLIDSNRPTGEQLKRVREYMGFTTAYVASKIGWDRNNIYHLEKSNHRGIGTIIKYSKAIGIQRIVITI